MKNIVLKSLAIIMLFILIFSLSISVFSVNNSRIPSYTSVQAEQYAYMDGGRGFVEALDFSMSAEYLKDMKTDTAFMASVSAWEAIHIATSPSYTLKSGMITKSEFYKTILFDLINSDFEDSELSKYSADFNRIYKMIKNEQNSYAISTAKTILGAEYKDNTVSYEEFLSLHLMDKEDKDLLLYGTKYADVASVVSDVNKYLGYGKSGLDAVKTFATFMTLTETQIGQSQVLRKIGSDKSNNTDLRDAANQLAASLEDSRKKTVNALLEGTLVGLKAVSDHYLDKAWDSIISAIPGGKEVLYAAKGTRILCNTLFNTDDSIKNFYQLSAVVDIENALKKASNSLRETLDTDGGTTDNSEIYMQSIYMFENCVLMGFDYSIELLESAITSKMDQIFDGWFGDYSEGLERINLMESFKEGKIKNFETIEEITHKYYKLRYCPDFDELSQSLDKDTVPIISMSVTQSNTLSVGDKGSIYDFFDFSYAPSNHTEIAVEDNVYSSDNNVIKTERDMWGNITLEAVGEGSCILSFSSCSEKLLYNLEVKVSSDDDGELDYSGFQVLSANELNYTLLDDGTARINGFVGKSAYYSNVIIPSEIGGCSVSEVYLSGVKDSIRPKQLSGIVVVSNGIIKIGLNNLELSRLILPESITYIEYIKNCKNLKQFNIPSNVKSIGSGEYVYDGYSTFNNDDSLNRIDIDDISKWCEIDFYNLSSNPLCYAHNLFLNGSLIKNLVIPEGVKTIKDYAFAGGYFDTIDIPNSVKSIKSYSFSGCKKIKNLVIPDSVTEIEDNCLNYCFSIRNLVLPFIGGDSPNYQIINDLFDKNQYSGYSTTYSNAVPNLRRIVISRIINIPDNAFRNMKNLESIRFIRANHNSSIGKDAFSGCSSLTSIIIPDGINNIGSYAFSSCANLTNISIPSSVHNIEDSAFYGCEKLEYVKIADIISWCNIIFGNYNSNPLLYANKFYIDNKLVTDVVVPDSVTSIHDYAFAGCSYLKSIVVPNSVTYIGEWSLYKCISLESLTLPFVGDGTEKNTELMYLFGFYPSKLETVEITNTDYIGKAAFYNFRDISNIILPNEIKSIDDAAFYCCENLKSINIPAGVTHIGDSAFYGCKKITKLDLPNGLKSIGETAFMGSGLSEFILPDSVETVGSEILRGCINLEKISVCIDSEKIENISLYYYFNNTNYVGWGLPNSLTEINIINTEKILENSFSSNRYESENSITKIVLPDSLTTIGKGVFSNFKKLNSINIPDGVISIGDYAFNGCSELTNITIPENTLSIGIGAFKSCSGLSSIYIPNRTVIGESAFENCTGLTDVVISEGVFDVGKNAFAGCSGLTNVIIPNSVTNIGFGAFRDCINIESITLPFVGNGSTEDKFGYIFGGPNWYNNSEFIPSKLNNVIITKETRIGEYAFADCSGITNISIPESVTEIGNFAFVGCTGLTNLTIPDSVTVIGQGVLQSCSNIESLTLPFVGDGSSDGKFWHIFGPDTWFTDSDSVPLSLKTVIITKDTIIQHGAFSGCSGLEEIILPDSITDIEEEAFAECKSLDLVRLPSSLNRISNYCFFFCENLEHIVLPDSVKTLGIGAFKNCTNLKEVVLPLILDTIEYNTFDNCPSLDFIYFGHTENQYTKIENNHTISAQVIFNQNYFDTYQSCDHSYLWNLEKVEPTCVNNGHESGQRCALCGHAVSGYETISATGHTEVVTPGKPATCTEEGLRDYISCSVCNTVISEQTAIPKTEHIDNNHDSFCDICASSISDIFPGETKSVTIKSNEITYLKFIPSKSGTYSFKSFSNSDTYGYLFDGNKNEITDDDDSGSDSNFMITYDLEKGTTYYFGCRYYSRSNSGSFVVLLSLDKIICDHENTQNVESVLATCTESGYTAGVKCVDCEEYLSGHETIDAFGHSGEWVVRVQATCTVEGEENRNCSVCGTKETRVVSRISHTDSDNDAICDICGNSVSDILPGETKTVAIISDEITYLKFIPSVSGTYTFRSNSNSDTFGYLFDVDKNFLMSNDDGGSDSNFKITYDLEKGKVYYWGCRYYEESDSGSFDVSLSLDEAFCDHENTTVIEASNATCTEPGYTEGVKCEDCGLFISGHEITENASGHIDVNNDKICDVCGDVMAYIVGDHILYGNYPQSLETDESIIAQLNSIEKNWTSYQYYTGSCTAEYLEDTYTTDNPELWDGKMHTSDYMYYSDIDVNGDEIRDYRAVRFDKYRQSFTGLSVDRNIEYNRKYNVGEVYYFKYEPISWRILDPSNGLILTENILDSQAFNNFVLKNGSYWGDSDQSYYANDYYHSSLRKWLNDDFYNTAFNGIQSSNIRNDISINNDSYNHSYTLSSKDKVFLLSYDELNNDSYRLNSNELRRSEGTDYAESQLLYINNYYNCSDWWLRSSNYGNLSGITVRYNGEIEDFDCLEVNRLNGIRVACRLSKLKNDVSGTRVNNTIGSGLEGSIFTCSHLNVRTIEGKAATCTQDGYTSYNICEDCGKEITSRVKIAKLGHSSDNGTVTLRATCSTTGIKTFKCTICGEVIKTESVAKIPHVEINISGVNPTCTTTGKTNGKKCSVCGETIISQDVIPALDHTSDAGTVTKDATCTEMGEKTFRCTVCGEVLKTESINKTAHKLVVIPAVEPKCSAVGKTEGKKCSICGTITVAPTDVAKLPHTYKNVVTKATLTVNGKITPTCSVCGAKKTATAIYMPKTFTLSATKATYTGKAIKPTVTVKDSKGNAIDAKYYTVTYADNTNVGTATVTIKFKTNYSGTKTLNFTIAPKQVTGLKSSSEATTSLKLSWTKVTGAKYYKVEQSTDGKTWTVIAKANTTNSLAVSKLKAGTKYQFRVTALDSTKKIAGKASAVLKTGTLTAAPTIKLTSTKKATATVTITKVTGASKYIVYKSTDNKKWTKVADTTGTIYNLTKLSAGKKIYVKVVAVNAYGKNSSYSKVASVTVKK